MVGIVPTPSGNGYWLATSDGKVYPFGDAGQGVIDYGPLEEDWAVGLVPADRTTTGGVDYRLVTARGRTLPSAAALNNATAATGAVRRRAGPWSSGHSRRQGLLRLQREGPCRAFGDASSYGDLRAVELQHTITTVAATPSGKGYYLLADDGSLYAFGDALLRGNAQSVDPNGFYTGILLSAGGKGYRLVTWQGRVHTFGDAVNYGSLYNVPTKGGKATFAYTSLDPGSTTVTALGPRR